MIYSATVTVDLEEVFHVQALAGRYTNADWDHLPSRLEGNVRRVLALLARTETRATFFILGWVAQRWPHLIRAIREAGHEIASHGFRHAPIYDQTPGEFRDDLLRGIESLERAAGLRPRGYRAPTFSILPQTTWALDVIQSVGFRYDASVFPIAGHDFYGFPGASRFAYRHPNGLLEIPASTVCLFGRRWPVGGGGYLRLYPYWLTRWAIRRINADAHPAVVYFHPWELDPEQPRVKNIRLRSRFRTYVNLRSAERKLEHLFREFRVGPISEVFASELGSDATEVEHAR